MEAIADIIIEDIVKNYSPKTMPLWQPIRIKYAISKISKDIANGLDYTTPSNCVKSLSKRLDIDITPLLVKHKFPIWVEPENENILFQDTNGNKNVVITYVSTPEDGAITIIDRMKRYASKIDADMIVLTGRTQGYEQLEKFRFKAFIEQYERSIIFDANIFIHDNAPNLFNVVPSDRIGICDDRKNKNLRAPITKKIFLLKADAFNRTGIMSPLVHNACTYEAENMDTDYDDSVIVCNKKHSDLWTPFPFVFNFKENENRAWLEILLYRTGHAEFELPKNFSQSILDQNRSEWNILRYERVRTDQNIIHTWFDDNNIVGYMDKNPLELSEFKILSLYHRDEQLKSIQNKEYIDFVNLNQIESQFDNSFTESRIYYLDFEKLFPNHIKYCGLTTGSWNLKYVGLNPIDKLEHWKASRLLDDNTILCSDVEDSLRFYRDSKSVMQEIFPSITPKQISEFIEMIGLEKVDKKVAIANQLIATRSIVKELFDFYQNNQILDKIKFFYNKYDFNTRTEDMYIVRSGYFSELTTLLWIAQRDFEIMPQEILRQDWYK